MSEVDDLRRELQLLSARMARIEVALRIHAIEPSAPVRAAGDTVAKPADAAAAPKSGALPVVPAPKSGAQPVVPASAQPVMPNAPASPAHEAALEPAPAQPPAPSSPENAAILGGWTASTSDTESDAVMAGPARSSSLELLIGGKAMAWIGAIAVLLGAAFAIAVGVQRGWWGSLPPAARCVGIAVAGAALLAGGEVALRRIGRAASAGLFGAALGTLYMDAFATFRYFDLLEAQGAFVLMAAVAVIGFAVTYRTRFLSIGVLSIIGGYLTPLLLRGQSGRDVELLVYLTMLLGISLGLSARLPQSFGRLRYAALAAHAAVALLWVRATSSSSMASLVFLSGWWAMAMAESVLAARRGRSPRGNVAMALLVTTLYVLGAFELLHGIASGTPPLGPFTASVAFLSAVLATQFGTGLDALRRRPDTAIERLTAALWLQCGVLLATAIGLHFDDLGQTIGWLVVGMGAVELGRRLDSRGVTIYGLAVGAAALCRVWLWDWALPSLHRELGVWESVRVDWWSILAVNALMVTHLAGQRIRFRGESSSPSAPVVLAALANLQWLGVIIACCSNLAVTGGWLFGVVFLMALEPWGRRQKYFEIALSTLAVTAARWLIEDALSSRMDPAWSASAALPVLNAQMGMAAAIAATGWWAQRILRSPRRQRPDSITRHSAAWQWLVVAGMLFLLIAASFEVDRAVLRRIGGVSAAWSGATQMRQLMLTLLWAFGAIGVGLLIRSGRRAGDAMPTILFVFAWLIVGLCVVKWIVVDTMMGWDMGLRVDAAGALPLANAQMVVGVALAAALLALRGLTRPEGARMSSIDADEAFFRVPIGRLDVVTPIASCAILLWGLTFEVDRALGRVPQPWPNWLAAWPLDQLRGLLWTALWSAGGVAMMLAGKWRRAPSLRSAGWMLLVAGALAWLTYGTLMFRIDHPIAPVKVIANVQCAVGALLAALLVGAIATLRREAAAAGEARARDLRLACHVSRGVIALIGLVLGSFEINRWFTPDWSGVQTGLSVYWGVYGVALVLIGFTRNASTARYAGLALLGVTIVKALVYDMKNVDLVWRALIFVVVGLLFIGVSVVYAKVAPRMFGDRDERGPRP